MSRTGYVVGLGLFSSLSAHAFSPRENLTPNTEPAKALKPFERAAKVVTNWAEAVIGNFREFANAEDHKRAITLNRALSTLLDQEGDITPKQIVTTIFEAVLEQDNAAPAPPLTDLEISLRLAALKDALRGIVFTTATKENLSVRQAVASEILLRFPALNDQEITEWATQNYSGTMTVRPVDGNTHFIFNGRINTTASKPGTPESPVTVSIAQNSQNEVNNGTKPEWTQQILPSEEFTIKIIELKRAQEAFDKNGISLTVTTTYENISSTATYHFRPSSGGKRGVMWEPVDQGSQAGQLTALCIGDLLEARRVTLTPTKEDHGL